MGPLGSCGVGCLCVGCVLLDAIGETNALLAGINSEIVRQDIAANY